MNEAHRPTILAISTPMATQSRAVRGLPARPAHAVQVAQGQGMALRVMNRATGGGTDAAFAGLRPKGGVLEAQRPLPFN